MPPKQHGPSQDEKVIIERLKNMFGPTLTSLLDDAALTVVIRNNRKKQSNRRPKPNSADDEIAAIVETVSAILYSDNPAPGSDNSLHPPQPAQPTRSPLHPPQSARSSLHPPQPSRSPSTQSPRPSPPLSPLVSNPKNSEGRGQRGGQGSGQSAGQGGQGGAGAGKGPLKNIKWRSLEEMESSSRKGKEQVLVNMCDAFPDIDRGIIEAILESCGYDQVRSTEILITTMNTSEAHKSPSGQTKPGEKVKSKRPPREHPISERAQVKPDQRVNKKGRVLHAAPEGDPKSTLNTHTAFISNNPLDVSKPRFQFKSKPTSNAPVMVCLWCGRPFVTQQDTTGASAATVNSLASLLGGPDPTNDVRTARELLIEHVALSGHDFQTMPSTPPPTVKIKGTRQAGQSKLEATSSSESGSERSEASAYNPFSVMENQVIAMFPGLSADGVVGLLRATMYNMDVAIDHLLALCTAEDGHQSASSKPLQVTQQHHNLTQDPAENQALIRARALAHAQLSETHTNREEKDRVTKDRDNAEVKSIMKEVGNKEYETEDATYSHVLSLPGSPSLTPSPAPSPSPSPYHMFPYDSQEDEDADAGEGKVNKNAKQRKIPAEGEYRSDDDGGAGNEQQEDETRVSGKEKRQHIESESGEYYDVLEGRPNPVKGSVGESLKQVAARELWELCELDQDIVLGLALSQTWPQQSLHPHASSSTFTSKTFDSHNYYGDDSHNYYGDDSHLYREKNKNKNKNKIAQEVPKEEEFPELRGAFAVSSDNYLSPQQQLQLIKAGIGRGIRATHNRWNLSGQDEPDLGTRLRVQDIARLFPTLDPHTIHLYLHTYRDRTIAVLAETFPIHYRPHRASGGGVAATAVGSAVPASPSLSLGAMAVRNVLTDSVLWVRVAPRLPVGIVKPGPHVSPNLPTPRLFFPSPGDPELRQATERARERSAQYAATRRYLQASAAFAMREGGPSVHHYTRHADLAKKGAACSQERAIELNFSYHNPHPTPNTVDMHGLFAAEAITILDFIVRNRAPNLSHLVVITGRGKQSRNGHSRLRPACLSYLEANGIRFTSSGAGALRISDFVMH